LLAWIFLFFYHPSLGATANWELNLIAARSAELVLASAKASDLDSDLQPVAQCQLILLVKRLVTPERSAPAAVRGSNEYAAWIITHTSVLTLASGPSACCVQLLNYH